MNPLLKNILAILAGLVLGTVVNLGLIMIGSSIIPAPAGVDPMDIESIKANMDAFETKHLIFPFLAHALGTLAGAFAATKIAANNKLLFALVIGAWFLVGGIMMMMQVPGPMWFNILDLVGAYIPMAFWGHKLATK